jgi:hypothetical protein
MALIVLVAGCANVEAPPGTGPDFEPPGVVERYPAPGAVVPELDDDAWIRFDEPLQSPRNLERSLDISPAWDWRFNPRISGFSVRPREGWRQGAVYRIRIAPGVSDLIRNRTRQVIEWTFSTGPAISETRIDGIVYDRVTVSGVPDARLLFLSADSVPYSVVSDTGGVYGMRSLPPADYTVYAFLDRNRNRRLDRQAEPWDSATVSLPEPSSRYAVDLWMIPPDSTPPRLLSVVAFDTLTLSLEFDEPLDPEASLEEAVVTVSGPPGLEAIPVAGMRVGQPGTVFRDDSEAGVDPDTASAEQPRAEPGAIEDELREEVSDSLTGGVPSTDSLVADSLTADSLIADSPVADSLVADSLVADTAAALDPSSRGSGRLQSAELREMPFNTLVVRLEQALTEDSFRVAVSGVPNLRGLRGGGDTTFAYVAPLPAVAPDSIAESDSGRDAPTPGQEAGEPGRDQGIETESLDPPAPARPDSAAISAPARPVRRPELRPAEDPDG